MSAGDVAEVLAAHDLTGWLSIKPAPVMALWTCGCGACSGNLTRRTERHLGATNSPFGTTGRENGEQGDEK